MVSQPGPSSAAAPDQSGPTSAEAPDHVTDSKDDSSVRATATHGKNEETVASTPVDAVEEDLERANLDLNMLRERLDKTQADLIKSKSEKEKATAEAEKFNYELERVTIQV